MPELQNLLANLALEAKQDAQIVRQDAMIVLETAIRDLLALIEAQTPMLVGGEVPVTALTDAELRAAPVPVSGSFSIPGVATEVTLAALLAKVIAAPSTEAKQDAIITALGGVATQATLAALLAKVIAAPATEAKQDTGNTALASIVTNQGTDGSAPPAVLGGGTGIRGWLRSIYEKLTGTIAVTGSVTANTGLAQPLTDAELRASPVPVSGSFSVTGGATEAKQDTQITRLNLLGTEVTAAAILAKLTADPATQTTLAAILAKLIAAPATEAKQDTIIARFSTANNTPGNPAVIFGTTLQGVRQDLISAINSDGRITSAQFDRNGSLRVAASNEFRVAETSGWGSGAQAITISTNGFSSVTVTIRGTYATFTPLFEVSQDGTNFFALPAVIKTTRTIVAAAGVATGANASVVYAFDCTGFPQARVRTAAGPASGSATIHIAANAQPLPLDIQTVNTPSGTQTVSGTVTATVASTTANLGTAGGSANLDSTTPLGIGATFTGTFRDLGVTLGVFRRISVNFWSDVASAADGAILEISSDGVTARTFLTATLVAGRGVSLELPATTRYYRIRYINGAIAQTGFLASSMASRT